jgi:small ligand-binding sensory domain FIST
MFGHSGAELQIIREQLGDIPLIGFFASGEICGDTLYGYTGILTLIY